MANGSGGPTGGQGAAGGGGGSKPTGSAPKASSAVPGAFTTYRAQGNREDLAPRRFKRKRRKGK